MRMIFFSFCIWCQVVNSLSTLNRSQNANWIYDSACSADVLLYHHFFTYLLVFLVQNQGFYLCIERIGRFHQSKCTWQEFYFRATPMLNNDPKPFCWSRHLEMFPVFLTSGDRNDRKKERKNNNMKKWTINTTLKAIWTDDSVNFAISKGHTIQLFFRLMYKFCFCSALFCMDKCHSFKLVIGQNVLVIQLDILEKKNCLLKFWLRNRPHI